MEESGPPGHEESALEAVERAERRLEERSVERTHERERLIRRRRRREAYRLPLRAVGYGVGGALVFLVTIQAAGGDLSDLPGLVANLIVAAEFLAPAGMAGWASRDEGPAVAVAVGVCAFAIQLALAIGLGFAVLGMGPD
jgi:hypothetical protein